MIESSLQRSMSNLRLGVERQLHGRQCDGTARLAAAGLVPRATWPLHQTSSKRPVLSAQERIKCNFAASLPIQQIRRIALVQRTALVTSTDLLSPETAAQLKAPESFDIDTSYLDSLSPEQLAAVLAPVDAQIRVVAGPGSGKTRVLMARVAHLIAVGGFKPSQLMAITFTKRAGEEIKERLREQLGAVTAGKLTTGTFHAAAARMLRRNIQSLHGCGRSQSFAIHDTEDNVSLVKEWCKEQSDMRSGAAATKQAQRGESTRFKKEAKQMLSYISSFKSSVPSAHGFSSRDLISVVLNQKVVTPGLAALKQPGSQATLDDIEKCMGWYETQLKSCNAVDFDDLLSLANAALQDVNVASGVSKNYRHILVDEFQDTNAAQYEFVRVLSEAGSRLFVVGDPDQSIYSFRGSNASKMDTQFLQDFPATQTLFLRDNYRSTPEVLEAAMCVLPLEVPLVAITSGDSSTQVVSHATGYTEAQWIATEFTRLYREGLPWSEMAVLFRTNLLTRAVEDQMVKAGIPYKLLGGIAFWSRQEVKDVASYLRVIVNLTDVTALRRIINMPVRKLGPKTITALQDWAASFDETLPLALFKGCHDCDPDELPPLPPAKEMGLKAAAYASVQRFRLTICTARHFARSHSIAETIDHILHAVKYKDHVMEGKCGSSTVKTHKTADGVMTDEEFRWGNVQQVRQAAQEFAQNVGGLTLDHDPLDDKLTFSLQPMVQREGLVGLGAFLEDAALLSGDPEDSSDGKSDAVLLITMHKAKGLEFTAVCVAAMEEGQLPHSFCVSDSDIREERRIAYVALTRAKRHLIMSHARTRALYGEYKDVERSRFLRRLAPPNETEGGTHAQMWCDSGGDGNSYAHDCNDLRWRELGAAALSNTESVSGRGLNPSCASDTDSSSRKSFSSSLRNTSGSSRYNSSSSKERSSILSGGDDDVVRSNHGPRNFGRFR